MDQEFELKTSIGIKKHWGKDGPDAAQQFADKNPGVIVYAWRYPRYQIVIGLIKIIEPQM